METTLPTNNRNTGTSNGSGVAGALGSSSAISDMFTKLLVAQIKNQNPLEPTDPADFVNQLTQLSHMEALQKLADQGTANASMMSSMQMLALGAQVGSQLTVQTDQVVLGDKPVPIGFALDSSSNKNTLVLSGSDGKETRIELGSRNSGQVNYSIDAQKLGLVPGNYTMRVETATKEEPKLQVTGVLSSVQLSSTGALLNVTGAGPVLPAAIARFDGRPAASTQP